MLQGLWCISVTLASKQVMLQSESYALRATVSIPGQAPRAVPLSCHPPEAKTGRHVVGFWSHPFGLAVFLSWLHTASFIGERTAGTVLRISLYLLATRFILWKPRYESNSLYQERNWTKMMACAECGSGLQGLSEGGITRAGYYFVSFSWSMTLCKWLRREVWIYSCCLHPKIFGQWDGSHCNLQSTKRRIKMRLKAP